MTFVHMYGCRKVRLKIYSRLNLTQNKLHYFLSEVSWQRAIILLLLLCNLTVQAFIFTFIDDCKLYVSPELIGFINERSLGEPTAVIFIVALRRNLFAQVDWIIRHREQMLWAYSPSIIKPMPRYRTKEFHLPFAAFVYVIPLNNKLFSVYIHLVLPWLWDSFIQNYRK